MISEFRKIMAEREEISSFKVPRYLWTTDSDLGTHKLHGFYDASKLSFGCAINLLHRTVLPPELILVFSKGRIPPIQQ